MLHTNAHIKIFIIVQNPGPQCIVDRFLDVAKIPLSHYHSNHIFPYRTGPNLDIVVIMSRETAESMQFDDERYNNVSFSGDVTQSPDRSINVCAKLFPESPIQLGDGSVHAASMLTGAGQPHAPQETSIYFDNSEILSESKDYSDVSRIGQGNLMNTSLPGLPVPTVPYASPFCSPLTSPAAQRHPAASGQVFFAQGTMPHPPHSPLPTLPHPRVAPDANSISAPNSPANSPVNSPAHAAKQQAPMSPRLQVLNSPVFKYPAGTKAPADLAQPDAPTHPNTVPVVPIAVMPTQQLKASQKQHTTTASATGFTATAVTSVTQEPTLTGNTASPSSPVALVKAAIERIAGPVIGSPIPKSTRPGNTPQAQQGQGAVVSTTLTREARVTSTTAVTPMQKKLAPGSPYQCGGGSPILGSAGTLPSSSHAFSSGQVSGIPRDGIPASPPPLAPLTLPPSPPSPNSPMEITTETNTSTSFTVGGIPFTLYNNTDPTSAAPAVAPASPPQYQLNNSGYAQTAASASYAQELEAHAQANLYAQAYVSAFDAHISQSQYPQPVMDSSFNYSAVNQSLPNYGALDFSTELPQPTVTPIRSPHSHHTFSPMSPNTTRMMPPLSPISALPSLPLPTIESNGPGSPPPQPYLSTRVAVPPTPIRQKLFSPMNHTPTHPNTQSHAQGIRQQLPAELVVNGVYNSAAFASPFAQLAMYNQQQMQQMQQQFNQQFMKNGASQTPLRNEAPEKNNSQRPTFSGSSSSSLKASKWLGLIVSIGSLLSKVPQAIEVFSHKSVQGLSLPMFAMVRYYDV